MVTMVWPFGLLEYSRKSIAYNKQQTQKCLQLINPLGMQGAMGLAVTSLGHPNVHIVQEQYPLSAAPGTIHSARRYIHPHPRSPAPLRPLTLNVGTSDSPTFHLYLPLPSEIT